MDQRRSPSASERKRDPERTRALLLEAAAAEFGAKGYAATRTTDIAARAGVNKQLISYYFGGKEGLYKELATSWHGTAAEMASPEQPLDTVLAGFVHTTLTDHGRLWAWSNLADDSPPTDEAFLRAQVEQMRERQNAGELPADLDPGFLLLALMAAASAPLTLRHTARQITGEDPATPEFATKYAEQLALLVRHLSGRT
ncbi:DNA-binding transcriptional regulator, AcrR family [Lentzea waywayandensis]|uniref:DNA-binding transcriptional regulator, AcrR family n=1 Tax=Lentzea waywayandensis TaxID=84724 RepID=A0A1I6EQP4_9PSEU|nr:TetR/AcrR family transcriptional regulator [Lentzea waywayandensis]SFR19907.1 DNA-binding transcriptional regulator, AcrR family [Lentzea waywayandensis]